MTEQQNHTAVTDDAFLGGRLNILQPRSGYRAGIDPVLLAASCPDRPAERLRVLDVGAGVGVVGLCMATRCKGVDVILLERQAALADLARQNAVRNGLAARVSIVEADLGAPAGELEALGIARDSFDLVLANPPYREVGRGRSPPDRGKAVANEMPAGDLETWARVMARMTKPGGGVAMIHEARCLGDVLAALSPRFGGLRVLPVLPRAAEPAHRIIVHGQKGSRAPLTLLPALVLHGAGSAFLPEIDAVLRAGAPLPGIDPGN